MPARILAIKGDSYYSGNILKITFTILLSVNADENVAKVDSSDHREITEAKVFLKF